jgi:hypothetical protein
MTLDLRRKETLLIETLLSALDTRESAKAAEAPMLVYLSEMLVQRVRAELEAIKEAAGSVANGENRS